MTMSKELTKLQESIEKKVSLSEQEFSGIVNKIKDDLGDKYDPSKETVLVRPEWRGGKNYAKTLDWVTEYANNNPSAMESIATALYAIINYPESPKLAMEIRRFIKNSSLIEENRQLRENYIFDNTPYVIEFGRLISQIARVYEEKSLKPELRLNMDFLFYGASPEPEATYIKRHEELVVRELDKLRETLKKLTSEI